MEVVIGRGTRGMRGGRGIKNCYRQEIMISKSKRLVNILSDSSRR
jgi:hypothetical protein